MQDTNKIRKGRTQQNVKAFFEEHGRIPPQAIDLEESVLGALLIEKEALSSVIEILKPEAFYKESHQLIFDAVQQLYIKQEPVDTLTVVEQLRRNGCIEDVGGPAFIVQLTRKVLSSANVEYHARIVLQKFIQRELIQISSGIIRKAYEDTTDVFDLLNDAEEKLFGVSEKHLRYNTNALPKLLQMARENIEKASKIENNLIGVPSGFTELDRLTSGWQNSDLIIIAARPAMGKTAFVLSLARNTAVINRKPVAVFSLEMSAIQIATRLLAAESQVSSDRIRKGMLNDDEKLRINNALNILSEAPIFIDDTPALSVFELRTKCRRLKQKNNIELIVIDYMQLMTGTTDAGGTREQEISSISRSVKALAKELNVPILCLSQLSRNVEKRPGQGKPQLSDLRESGSIEQDADIVIFLYRAEYYKLQPENNVPGSAEIIIAKHRNGPIDSVHLKFVQEFAQFKDIDNFDSFKSYVDLSVNENFDSDEKTSMTIPSRLNSMEEEPDY
jgi:replicative DNA helicase